MAKNKVKKSNTNEVKTVEPALLEESNEVVETVEKPEKEDKKAKPAKKEAKVGKKKAKNSKPRRNFIKEIVSELKKVNWPSFKKACKQTGAVLVVVAVFMLVVFGIDKLLLLVINLISKLG